MVLIGKALLLPLHWHCRSQSNNNTLKEFLSQPDTENQQPRFLCGFFKLLTCVFQAELWIHPNVKRGRNNDIIFIIFNSPRKAVISAVPNVADVWTLESRVANNPSVFNNHGEGLYYGNSHCWKDLLALSHLRHY